MCASEPRARLTAEGCQARVERASTVMGKLGLDAAIFEDKRDILYFCGAWLRDSLPAALLIPNAGELLLVRNANGPVPLIGEAVDYQGQDLCSVLRFARKAMIDALQQAMPARPGPRLGVSREHGSLAMSEALAAMGAEPVDIDAHVFAMQQLKHDDEIAVLRAAIAVNESAYEAVLKELRPGLTELDVFHIAYGAICGAAGDIVDYAGDFQCGQAGGRARPRAIPAGELYIVDSYPIVNGYWSDMCRTFAVGEPSADQRAAHAKVADSLAMVEATVKPGQRTGEVFDRIAHELEGLPFAVSVMPHHAGHGIGLRAHEWPHFWPHAEHTFQPRQVFTCEPGVYGEALRGGVRLEETFLVTDTGLEKLTQFPLELK